MKAYLTIVMNRSTRHFTSENILENIVEDGKNHEAEQQHHPYFLGNFQELVGGASASDESCRSRESECHVERIRRPP